MNIICNKQILTEAIANISRAVSSKTTLAALEGILFKASGTTLNLTGYDLEMGISTTIEVRVLEEGEIILSAKLLLDIVKRMPSNEVSISCDEKMLTLIKSAVTEYTVLGIPASEFPELPSITDATEIILSQGLLKTMISQTLFAVAVSDAKPVHTGSLFDLKEGILSVVSVDGYRLALRKENVKSTEQLSFIVPGKTLSEICKLVKDDDNLMQLFVSHKHIIFKIDGYHIVSRLLEGDFLDYKAAIPQSSSTVVRINTRSLIESIERTALLISDSIKSPLCLNFSDNLIKLSCSTAIGKAYDEINSSMDGDGVEIGFNSRYMIDALRAADCDEVQLIINGPLSPMKVVPLAGDAFTFLVLPVRLKSES